MDKLNKTFCYDIFKNIAIRSHNDKVQYSPCSFYKENESIGETSRINISDIWNKSEHLEVKDKSLTGKTISGCSYCYKQEENNLRSRRLTNIELYEKYLIDSDIKKGPVSLDYCVGNLCNLQCAVCHPGNSSSWIADFKKLQPQEDVADFLYRKNNQHEITDDPKLANIRNVHFHGGGEPLLTDHHLKLLQAIKNVKGSLSDVHVFYNTNATVTVSDDVLKLWSECKLVEIYFSIDDIAERFEYQRPGSKWQNVMNTITWFKDNMHYNHMFKINCVYGYLNFYWLPQLVNWHKMFLPTNRLGDEVQLFFDPVRPLMLDFSLQSLTEHQHNLVKQRFSNYPVLLDILNSIKIDNTETHARFFKEVQTFDNLKSKSYYTYHSEWLDILKNKIFSRLG